MGIIRESSKQSKFVTKEESGIKYEQFEYINIQLALHLKQVSRGVRKPVYHFYTYTK